MKILANKKEIHKSTPSRCIPLSLAAVAEGAETPRNPRRKTFHCAAVKAKYCDFIVTAPFVRARVCVYV